MAMPKGAELLSQAGKRLQAEFDSIKAGLPHAGERGSATERALIEFLNRHLPKRFRATSGFILDSEDAESRQADVIVYDQLDALTFPVSEATLIVPNDNVAAIIEVKSTLSKEELRDAANKIAVAKKLAKLPPQPSDTPLVHSQLQITRTRGVVFGYSSLTSIETLAKNLLEINAGLDSDHWIDEVVVLGAGSISYGMQFPLSGQHMHFAGKVDDAAIPFPVFVVVEVTTSAEAVLPALMARLTGHLSHYRRRPSLPINMLMPSGLNSTVAGAYWFTSSCKLEPLPEAMAGASTPPSKPALRISFLGSGEAYLGRAEWLPWADGHIWALDLELVPAGKLIRSTIFTPYRTGVHTFPASDRVQLTNVLPGSDPPGLARILATLQSASQPFRVRVEDFRPAPTKGAGGC